MIIQIYQAIKKKLETIAALEVVTWDNKQDEIEDSEELFTVPAVLISFEPVSTQGLTDRQQFFKCSFTVKLITESQKDIDKALIAHDEILQEIYFTLQGSNSLLSEVTGKPEDSGQQLLNTINRTGFIPDHIQTNLIRTAMSFECLVFDYLAVRKKVSKKLTLHLDVNYG